MKTSEIIDIIKDIKNLEILTDEPMTKHTSFKIGGLADVMVLPKTEEQIAELLKRAKMHKIPVTVIGAGSNLLVSDLGIRGLTIKLGSPFSEITAEGDIINAKSGASLAKIASVALKNSLSGFEFASGIPGTLGGAVYMNAGAYGGEMKDVVIKTRFMDFEGNIFTLENDEHDFSYRHSFFDGKDDLIILSSEIKLQKGEKSEIEAKMLELNKKRKEKQPLNYPSAGSAFKRPAHGYAAQLIEEAGLKGKKIGGAMVSKKHSGFIVNDGNATAKDVEELIEFVKKAVYDKFKVELNPEVRKIGEEN